MGVTYATHVGLACHPLHAFGSPMQKESFLRPMLRGDKLGAFALTEPEAGSDVGAIATTAELDGGFYVINGHKIMPAGPISISSLPVPAGRARKA
mgnify:CR=1 FL=1